MTDEPISAVPSPAPATRRRRFRRRELSMPDGSRLLLDADGVISHVDQAGGGEQSWTPDDPDWVRHALRFGLRVAAPTVAPAGRPVAAKPPRA